MAWWRGAVISHQLLPPSCCWSGFTLPHALKASTLTVVIAQPASTSTDVTLYCMCIRWKEQLSSFVRPPPTSTQSAAKL